MSKALKLWIAKFVARGVLACVLPLPAWAARAQQATPSGNEVYGFHVLIFGICVAVAAAVLGAMIWSIIRHRRSQPVEAGGFAHSVKAEIAWTAIPIAILVAMAAPAADSLLRTDDARHDEFTVTVTGYQWKWEYDYSDLGIRYASMATQPSAEAGTQRFRSGTGGVELDVDRPMVVPAGVKVRIRLTSNDVNHSWWVRDFGRRRNAIPGHINEFSFWAKEPGTYRGACAEYCGPGDTCVPAVVEALPAEAFAAWLQANAPAQPEGMPAALAESGISAMPRDLDATFAQGRVLHAKNCAGCHQASGAGLRAAGFPPLAGTRVSKDEHIRVALHGREGSAMAAFGSVLGDEELAAIVTYQRNAWGNDTGDIVEPADIAAAR